MLNQRIYNGIDVYEVGVKQVRDWFDWQYRNSCANDSRFSVALCDTTRKGAYILVQCCARFGLPYHFYTAFGNGTLKDAYAWYCCAEKSNLLSSQKMGCHYEIWHLVDDDELWADWQMAVDASKSDFCRDTLVALLCILDEICFFDVDAIIDDVTEVTASGTRVWRPVDWYVVLASIDVHHDTSCMIVTAS